MKATTSSVVALVVAVIFATAAGVIGREAVKDYFNSQSGTLSLSVLTRTASELNKTLPMMVDKETELINASALPGVVVYNYKMVNRRKTELVAIGFPATLKPSVTKTACSNPNTRDGLINRGANMRFSYVDRDGVYVGAFDVMLRDCQP